MKIKVHVPLAERGVITISGDTAREFMQGLITNDIQRVSPTCAIYAALLTPQG
jgi:folate-binding Fe-S cluster repair protein YgfZ